MSLSTCPYKPYKKIPSHWLPTSRFLESTPILNTTFLSIQYQLYRTTYFRHQVSYLLRLKFEETLLKEYKRIRGPNGLLIGSN